MLDEAARLYAQAMRDAQEGDGAADDADGHIAELSQADVAILRLAVALAEHRLAAMPANHESRKAHRLLLAALRLAQHEAPAPSATARLAQAWRAPEADGLGREVILDLERLRGDQADERGLTPT